MNFARIDGAWFAGPKLEHAPPFLVGHWSAGEGGPERIYRALSGRGLSCQFAMGLDGVTVQLAPLDVRCAHAGSLGNVGLGIEIANRGVPDDSGRSPRPFDLVRIRGSKVRAVRFTEAQIKSWVELCEWFAATYGAPRVVPSELRTYAPSEIRTFRGVLEHLHISSRKIDAGGHLVGALVSAGWQRVRPESKGWVPE